MLDIPQWILEIIKNDSFRCPICKADFASQGLVSIGVKEAARSSEKNVLFSEYICPKCKEVTRLELHEITLLEFATMVVESGTIQGADGTKDIHSPKKKPSGIPKAVKRQARSGITKKEFDKAKNMLNKDEDCIDRLAGPYFEGGNVFFINDKDQIKDIPNNE